MQVARPNRHHRSGPGIQPGFGSGGTVNGGLRPVCRDLDEATRSWEKRQRY